MTILVYGEKASRTHENQMLHVFLERLEDRWADSTDWIVAVANAMWNGAEIDLVCILPSAIIVADFKSYGGTLTGTENGPWQADGVIVKGGRKANPYQQLRDNKFSVLDWLQSKALLSGRNLGHISAGVIFSGGIEDQLELPSKVRSWFYPADLANCAVMLDGLSSPELRIARDEALEIVRRLGVQPIEWASSRPQVRDIHSRPDQPQARTPLTAHQREALQTLSSFLAADDAVSLSVLGMTSTGKSRLLLDKKDAANEMVDHFQADPSSVWYLAETHGQANALTQWIRERLHGKKLLDTMEVGDLLEVYVSPDVRAAFGSRVRSVFQ